MCVCVRERKGENESERERMILRETLTFARDKLKALSSC